MFSQWRHGACQYSLLILQGAQAVFHWVSIRGKVIMYIFSFFYFPFCTYYQCSVFIFSYLWLCSSVRYRTCFGKYHGENLLSGVELMNSCKDLSLSVCVCVCVCVCVRVCEWVMWGWQSKCMKIRALFIKHTLVFTALFLVSKHIQSVNTAFNDIQ